MTDDQFILEIARLKDPVKAGDVLAVTTKLINQKNEANKELDVLKELVRIALKSEASEDLDQYANL